VWLGGRRARRRPTRRRRPGGGDAVTVYVDQFPGNGWGRWSGGGHLLTSDLAALHALAGRIGLRRAWFQDQTFPHYDLTATTRQRALAAGAVPIEYGQFPDDLLVRGRDGAYEPYAARAARRAGVTTATPAGPQPAAAAPTPAPGPAGGPTARQHRAMHALWRQAGVTDRADRLALAAAAVGRPLATSNDLTTAETEALLGYMRRLHRAGRLAATVAAFLARPRPAADGSPDPECASPVAVGGLPGDAALVGQGGDRWTG